jgi:ubiquinone/menaquinone biosynthesis C-methylase UbiE
MGTTRTNGKEPDAQGEEKRLARAMTAGSYIIRGGAEGRERLRVLNRALRSDTVALLNRVGVRSGMRCLDAGCGGGDVTLELAARVVPGGQVVGIDLDETKLGLARAEAARCGIDNVSYVWGDVTNRGLPAGFDLVYARFVLTHLVEPEAATRGFVDLLMPGGICVVEDIDVSGAFCYPESDTYRAALDLYCATARDRGVDPDIGLRLPELLKQAGCHEVAVSVAQPVGARPDVGGEKDAKLILALTIEAITESAVEAGLATREEVHALVDELHALVDDEGTFMSMPRVVQAWGRRPL